MQNKLTANNNFNYIGFILTVILLSFFPQASANLARITGITTPAVLEDEITYDATSNITSITNKLNSITSGNYDQALLGSTELLLVGAGVKLTSVPAQAKVTGDAAKKTVNNPVDLTDFRKDHILNGHASGTNKSGKAEFPADWDQNKILHEISDVATDPNSTVTPGRWGADRIQGTRDGVDIRVDLYPSNSNHAGKISTGYPTNTPTNP